MHFTILQKRSCNFHEIHRLCFSHYSHQSMAAKVVLQQKLDHEEKREYLMRGHATKREAKQ